MKQVIRTVLLTTVSLLAFYCDTKPVTAAPVSLGLGFTFSGSTCEAGIGNQVTGVCGNSPTSLSSGATFNGTYDTSLAEPGNANIIWTQTSGGYDTPQDIPQDPFASSALTPGYTIRFDSVALASAGVAYFYTQNYTNPNLSFTLGSNPATTSGGSADTGEYSFLLFTFTGTLGVDAQITSGSFCYAGTNPATSANQCGNSNSGIASVIFRGVGNNIQPVPSVVGIPALLPVMALIKLRRRYKVNARPLPNYS